MFIAEAHRDEAKCFVAGREKKSQRTRLRKRPPRVGQKKSPRSEFHSLSLIGKPLRWEEVSQATFVMKKSQAGKPDLAPVGEIAQLKVRRARSISPSVLALE